jgi:hypothetical protein
MSGDGIFYAVILQGCAMADRRPTEVDDGGATEAPWIYAAADRATQPS